MFNLSTILNYAHIPLLTLCLFLSFNPTESEGSSLSLILRVLPFIFFLMYFIVKNIKLKLYSQGLFLILAFCIFILITKFNDLGIKVALQLVTIIFTYIFILIINKNNNESNTFLITLSILICIWIFFLFAQFLTFYSFGKTIDFHNNLFPFSNARGFLHASQARFGGLQIEPGTYSNWIFGTVVLRAFLIKKISTPLHWIAIISTLLTLSFWAYLSFVFFVIAASLERKMAGKILIIILLIILTIIFYYIFGDDILIYLQFRSELSSGTATGKLDVYKYMVENTADWLLIGSSLGSIPCNGCTSYQDAGVGFNLFFYFGSLIIFILGIFIVKSTRLLGVKGLFLITPIFFAKYYYWDPITILLITFIIVHKHRPAYTSHMKT